MQAQKNAEEEKKRQNVFYLNFEDFSVIKLKATVFFVYFPVTFTISILNLWLKYIPTASQAKQDTSGFTKEEQDGIT